MKLVKVVIINLIVVGLLLEGGMRIYYAVKDKAPPHSDHSMWREWRWVKSRLDDGKISFDGRFIAGKFTGWKNAPNLNTTDPFGSSIRTNSHGMRNDKNFSVKPIGKPRLMILGDSYSFGHGVSNEETYAYVLKKYMPSWEVMNFAVSATGTDQHYLMYEHHGKKFRPNIVMLGFYLRDFNRNTYSFRDYSKPMFVPQDDGSVILTNSPVLTPKALVAQYKNGQKKIGGWHYSYAIARFQNALSNTVKRSRVIGSLPRRTLTGIMEKYIKSVRDNGGIPIWVNFPVKEITKGPENKYDVIEAFSISEARRLGMPVLTLQPAFKQHLKQYPEISLWRPRNIGGHLSAEGNKLSAKTIYGFLKSQDLLKIGASLE